MSINKYIQELTLNLTLIELFKTFSFYLMDSNTSSIFGKMIELSEEIVFIYNIEKRCFDHVNEAFAEITQMDSAALFENPQLLFDFVHIEDREYIQEKINSLLQNKNLSVLTFRIIRADQQQRWIRVKFYPIIENDIIVYITGIGEDDTVRRASLLSMEKINAWKNASLEIVSHDLRGPIGTMKMLASVINRKLPDNPEIHKLASMIEEIANRNIELIKVLLSKETFESHEVQIRKERLDVVWEINQALEMYIKAQDDIKRVITFTYSHKKVFAELDSLKFLQIVNNLVSNAIKFTDENGQIKLHVEKLEDAFLFTVQDNGIGIPIHLQPLLFKKYTEAGRDGLKGEESVGLGMWIIKSMVEEHGGTIWFETKERLGTTFYVKISLGLES
ncbi:MAG: ATP-binding protein [Pedobacter sp.]